MNFYYFYVFIMLIAYSQVIYADFRFCLVAPSQSYVCVLGVWQKDFHDFKLANRRMRAQEDHKIRIRNTTAHDLLSNWNETRCRHIYNLNPPLFNIMLVYS